MATPPTAPRRSALDSTLALAAAALLPLTHFLKVLRGILLKGVGVAELWREMAILLAFATLLVALSVRRFRKTLD